MRLIDFHAHVLPGIDDGAVNLEESKQLLLSQKEQNIEVVVATPHYNHECTIEEFVKRRDLSLSHIHKKIKDKVPEIIPAAEVALYCGLSEEPELKRLCIGNTNYILIEMPYFYWNSWFYDELYRLENNRGLIPIIAHLERYINLPGQVNRFDKLLEQDVLVQINASSLLKFLPFQVVKKLLKRNAFTVLGSDCHDTKYRPCNFSSACKVINRRFGSDVLEKILSNAELILENKRVIP